MLNKITWISEASICNKTKIMDEKDAQQLQDTDDLCGGRRNT